MKNLLLILVMFVSSIAFAQEPPCNPEIQEDCSEVPDPIVFDFSCEPFDCDDLYWLDDTLITWVGNDGSEQYGDVTTKGTYYGYVFRSNGANLANNGDYTILNTSILRRVDDTTYYSSTGFILSVGGGNGGSIMCIKPNN